MLADLYRGIRARWLIVLLCTLASLAGGLVTASILPPRYVGHARILMELIKPDPETNEIIPSRMLETYVATNMWLAASPETTRHMVRQFGWVDDPALQAEFATTGERPDAMENWLAGRIAAGVSASVPPGTNLLDLSYMAPDPETAKLLVDALRAAFLTELVERKQTSARSAARQLDQQARRALERYFQTLNDRNAYARRRGFVVGQNTSRERSAAINLLDRGLAPTWNGTVPAGAGDAIARPDVSAAANTGDQSTSVTRSADEHMQTLVAQAGLAERTYLGIIAHRDQALQDARTGDSNMTAFGEAAVSPDPIFPDWGKVVLSSGSLGLILGVEVALLFELLHPRVRAGSDLNDAASTDVWAVVRRRRRLLPALSRPRLLGGGLLRRWRLRHATNA